MEVKDHTRLLLPALGGLSVVAIFISCLAGSVAIAPGSAFLALFGQESDAAVGTIIREIRLPRILAAFLVGAALGLAGAGLQGLLRNPLADPGVLGVSATAALGAVIAIYFNLLAVSVLFLPALSIGLSLAATCLIYVLGAGRVSISTLILIGVGLSSLAGALTALAMNLAPNPFSLSDMVNWLLGSVSNRSFDDIALALPFIVAGSVMILLAAPGIRALSLGEEAAEGIGADLRRTRGLVILGSAFAVGAAVSVAGTIGFVGIVTPHLVRPLVGYDPGRVLLPSALAGGLLLVLADLGVRLLPFDQELKIGVVAALFGAPVFILIAARLRRMAP